MKVSMIMPTFNRPQYTPMAVRCFLQQVYPDIELVIVNDGDAVVLYPPDDPRIKYIKLEARIPTGTKRNIAAEAATGEVIANLDDDDWSNPHRIQDQIQRLIKTGKAVTGYNTTISYEDKSGLFYIQRGGPPYFASGTSQCYWKWWWKEHPYPDASLGEDWAFTRTARLADQLSIGYPGKMMVARKHDNNTDAYPMHGRYPTLASSEISYEFFNMINNIQNPNYLIEPHVCTPECLADVEKQFNSPVVDAGYRVHRLPEAQVHRYKSDVPIPPPPPPPAPPPVPVSVPVPKPGDWQQANDANGPASQTCALHKRQACRRCIPGGWR